MSQESIYVGIDVSKEQVDVAVRPTGRSWSASYDGVGIDDLVAQLVKGGAMKDHRGGDKLYHLAHC